MYYFVPEARRFKVKLQSTLSNFFGMGIVGSLLLPCMTMVMVRYCVTVGILRPHPRLVIFT